MGDRTVRPAVVELKDGKVADCYELTRELPFTEWWGGTIEIVGQHAMHNGRRIV